MRLRVICRQDLAESVIGLTLANPGGEPLPVWEPGAHIHVAVPDGWRQYSLCGTPASAHEYRIAVLRDTAGRGGSTWIHDQLHVGTDVEVDGPPRNLFPLRPSRRHIFIAGGIGITPIVPMLASIDGQDSEWSLVYGGRTARSMAFRGELVERYGDRIQIRPQDEHGLLDLDSILATPQPDTLVYCCGPEPLLAAVEQHMADWPNGSLHVERFSPKPIDTSSLIDDTFTAVLARSGQTVQIPANRTILQTLQDLGIECSNNCQAGTCGECETAVLAGIPDHRDSLLTDAERAANDVIYPCVSRSLSAVLTLDL